MGYEPSISGDGSAVAFVSFGRDYAGGNDLGIDDDVFVWTRATGLISRVSVPTGGGDVDNGFNYAAQTPRLSHDARFVVFASHQHLTPGNTVTGLKVFLHDRQTGTTEIVSVDEQGVARTGRAPCLSDDGRLLAFTSNDRLVAADTDSVPDVHLRDRQAGTTVRVSVRTDGTPFPTQWCRDASMSGDGRFLSFTVNGKVAPPGQITQLLVDDVYLLDRTTGTVVEVSAGAYGESYSATNAAALSRDGTVLVFQTAGRNLDPRITDPYEAPLQVFRRPAGTR